MASQLYVESPAAGSPPAKAVASSQADAMETTSCPKISLAPTSLQQNSPAAGSRHLHATPGASQGRFLKGAAISIWQNSPDAGSSQWSRFAQRSHGGLLGRLARGLQGSPHPSLRQAGKLACACAAECVRLRGWERVTASTPPQTRPARCTRDTCATGRSRAVLRCAAHCTPLPAALPSTAPTRMPS